MDIYAAIKPLILICKVTGIGTFSISNDTGKLRIRLADKMLTLLISSFLFVYQSWRSMSGFNSYYFSIAIYLAILDYLALFNTAITFLVMYAGKKKIIKFIVDLEDVDFCLKTLTGDHPAYTTTRRAITFWIATYTLQFILLVIYFVYDLCKTSEEYDLKLHSLIQPYLSIIAFMACTSALNMSKMSLLNFFLVELRRRFEHINAHLTLNNARGIIEVHKVLRDMCKEVTGVFQLLLLTKVLLSALVILDALFPILIGAVEIDRNIDADIAELILSCGVLTDLVIIVYGFCTIRIEVS